MYPICILKIQVIKADVGIFILEESTNSIVKELEAEIIYH